MTYDELEKANFLKKKIEQDGIIKCLLSRF